MCYTTKPANCNCTSVSAEGLVIDLRKKGIDVDNSQLDTEIEEMDMFPLARLFIKVPTKATLEKLLLCPADIGNVLSIEGKPLGGIENAMVHVFEVWRRVSPPNATFRNLLEIFLDPGLGDRDLPTEILTWVARNVEKRRQLN